MKGLKKKTKKKIQKVEKMLRGIPVEPGTFSYMKIYQAAQELYFLGDYETAAAVCGSLLNE